jgi:hypothetical protein
MIIVLVAYIMIWKKVTFKVLSFEYSVKSRQEIIIVLPLLLAGNSNSNCVYSFESRPLAGNSKSLL